MNETEKLQNAFLWKYSISKIKREIPCNENKVVELKDVHIPNKFIAEDFNL